MIPVRAPDVFIGCDGGKHQIAVFDSRTCKTTVIANNPAALAAFAYASGDGAG
jgi:hypothetical protein